MTETPESEGGATVQDGSPNQILDSLWAFDCPRDKKGKHPGEDQRSQARSCMESVRTEDMEDTAGNTKEGLK